MSFIVLARDIRLIDYIRQRITNTADECDDHTLGDEDFVHDYLICLTREWGDEVGIPIEPAEVSKWMRDVALPSNVRPFVRFEVLVDDEPIIIRAGSTLLNLLDRRLGLSPQIFEARSTGINPAAIEAPSGLETRLVRTAAAQVSYRRRAGLGWQSVGLDRVTRLEDLLIPLKPGDELTWLR
jgi:hypothetical protein